MSYSDNTAVGTATATVIGKGLYIGTVTKSFEIGKTAIIPVVSITGWTYGDTANTPGVTAESNPGDGAVTYKYKVKDAADDTYSDTVPSNAGEYTVKATVAETDNYASGTVTKDFTISPKSVTIPTAVTGLYNPNSGEHFFTRNVGEKDVLITLGWSYEGVAWYAPGYSSVPVYRLYNPNAGDHHYTTNKGERDILIELGWNDEGIGWYSSESQAVPLYRLYNPNALQAGAHHHTINVGERDILVELGWVPEGVSWYGMDEEEAKRLIA